MLRDQPKAMEQERKGKKSDDDDFEFRNPVNDKALALHKSRFHRLMGLASFLINATSKPQPEGAPRFCKANNRGSRYSSMRLGNDLTAAVRQKVAVPRKITAVHFQSMRAATLAGSLPGPPRRHKGIHGGSDSRFVAT